MMYGQGHYNPNNMLYLTELMSSAAGSDGAQSTFPVLIDMIQRATQCERVTLFSVTFEGIVCKHTTPPNIIRNTNADGAGDGSGTQTPPTLLPGQAINLKESGLVGFVAKSGHHLSIRDTTSDWRFRPDTAAPHSSVDVKSILVVPVCASHGKTVGMIECINTPNRLGFSNDDLVLVRSIAACVSTMIQKADADVALKRRKKQSASLTLLASSVSADAQSEVGLGAVIAKIVRASHTVVQAERINLYLVHSSQRKVILEHSFPPLPDRELTNIKVQFEAAKEKFRRARKNNSHFINDLHNAGAWDHATPACSSDPSKRGDGAPQHTHAEKSAEESKKGEAGESIFMRVGEGLIGHVALMSAPMNVPDVSKDVRFDPKMYRYHTSKEDTEKALTEQFEQSLKKGFAPYDRQPTDSGHHDGSSFHPNSAKYHNVTPLSSIVSPASSSARNLTVNTHVRSILAVPVRDQNGKTMAVIEAINKPHTSGPFFTLEDQQLLTSFASTASGVLRQAVMQEESLIHQQKQQALFQIIELLSADIGTGKVVPRIIDASYELVGAERITMFTIEKGPNNGNSRSTFANQENRYLMCIVSKDEEMVGKKFAWGEGIVGHVAMTLHPLNIKDAYEDPRFSRDNDKSTGFTTRNILTIPVVDSNGEGVAVIQAINKVPSTTGVASYMTNSENFTNEDVTILGSLAATAGIILQKSKMYRKSAIAETRSHALMRLLKVISSHDLEAGSVHALRKVLMEVNAVAHDIMSADRVTTYFVDKGMVFTLASQNLSKCFSFPVGEGLAGYVAQTGEVINLTDAYDDPRFNKEVDRKFNYRTQSVLCVPVFDIEGNVIAVLQCLNKHLATMKKPVTTENAVSYDPNRKKIRKHSVMFQHSLTDKSFLPLKHQYAYFTRDDQLLLIAICDQISDHIRKCKQMAVKQMITATDTRGASLMSAFYSMEAPSAETIPAMERQESNKSVGPCNSVSSDMVPANLDTIVSDLSWPDKMGSFGVLTMLQSADFNVFDHSEDDLLFFSVSIFQSLGLLGLYDIRRNELTNFLVAVRSNYQDNPFHNWAHGFSVFHFSFYILKLTKVSDHLNGQDILGLLVASLCHDIDHPGNTNAFEINTSSEKALLYNDVAVLENHHASCTFKILASEKCNIFKYLSNDEQRSLRKTIISAILATDMSGHGTSLSALNERKDLQSFDVAADKDRMKLVKTLIHTSDFSGQTTPTHVAREWEKRIAEEFEQEVRQLEAHGIDAPVFMCNLDDWKTRNLAQKNFIDFVLDPWWKVVSRILPELSGCYAQLLDNRGMYLEASEGKLPPEAGMLYAAADDQGDGAGVAGGSDTANADASAK